MSQNSTFDNVEMPLKFSYSHLDLAHRVLFAITVVSMISVAVVHNHVLDKDVVV